MRPKWWHGDAHFHPCLCYIFTIEMAEKEEQKACKDWTRWRVCTWGNYNTCVCGGVHLLMRAYVETRGKPQVLSSVSLHLILLRKDLLLDSNAHLPLHCLDSQLLKSTCFLLNTAVTVTYHKAWVLCKFWIHTHVLTLTQQACYPIPPVHLLSLYLDSYRRRVAVEDNVENLTGNCEEQSESNLSLLRAPRPSLFSASVEKCLDSQGWWLP